MVKSHWSTKKLISVNGTREIKKFLNRSLLSILTILGVTNISCSALASGFALTEQSVKNLGNAAAGGAALAEDASTIFYNPAGLTLLTTFKEMQILQCLMLPKQLQLADGS